MFDMYGVKVINHPNLKDLLCRMIGLDILLLKSYPLEGDEVAKWYEVDKIFGNRV